MKLYKFISHCLFFLWVVFLTGCGEQSPAEEFTATLPELATETVRFSDSSQRNKDYFPVIVTWEYDRQIRRGEPASFNVMVTNMRDMIDMKITVELPEGLKAGDGKFEYNPGYVVAGGHTNLRFAAVPERDSEYTVSVHISALINDQRMGLVRTHTFQTAEYLPLSEWPSKNAHIQSDGSIDINPDDGYSTMQGRTDFGE